MRGRSPVAALAAGDSSLEKMASRLTVSRPAAMTVPRKAASAGRPFPVVRKVNSAPAEPVRIVSAVGPMLLKRLSPIAILGVIAVWIRHRRHKSNAWAAPTALKPSSVGWADDQYPSGDDWVALGDALPLPRLLPGR